MDRTYRNNAGTLSIVYSMTFIVLVSGNSCQFGYNCVYPCHCKNGATCDPHTGECPGGCDDGNSLDRRGAWTGPACQIGNVVLGTQASQTETFQDNEVYFGADNGVDGNLNQDLRSGACVWATSHHDHGVDWMALLGDSYIIQSISVIHNSNRGDAQAVEIWTALNSGNQVVCGFTEDRFWTNTTTVRCPQGTLADAVLLTSYLNDLRFCEVQAIGYLYRACSPGYFGPGCLVNCNCLEPCNGLTGVCDAGCVAGKTGITCQKDCPDRRWGNGCSNTCKCEDRQEVCDKVTGACPMSGCRDGVIGPNCNILQPTFDVSLEIVEERAESVILMIYPRRMRTVPRSQIGAPDYYIIQKSLSGRDQWQEAARVDYTGQNTYTVVVTGLLPDTAYDFNVVPMVVIQGVGYAAYHVTVASISTATTISVTVTSTGRTEPVLIGIAAAILLLAIVGIALLICRRKRHKKLSRKQSTQPLEANSYDEIMEGRDNPAFMADMPVVKAQTAVIAGLDLVSARRPRARVVSLSSRAEDNTYETIAEHLSNLIRVDRLEAAVHEMRNGPCSFAKEHQRLPTEPLAKCTIGLMEKCQLKNRSTIIVPYDHSRVTLKHVLGPGERGSYDVESPGVDSYTNIGSNHHYINASYIVGYKNRSRGYIACQGPLPNTVVDMWRMIWQEDIDSVMMLTNLVESGKVLCERYWPESGASRYGRFLITTEKTTKYADYVIRIFTISHEEESRRVYHYQFTSWPGHTVPVAPTALLECRRKMRAQGTKVKSPLLVHCCHGVGRTGTFIAIDHQLERARTEDLVDVLEYAHLMRSCRKDMIESSEQYTFVYEALREALALPDTAIPMKDVEDTYEERLRQVPGSNSSVITREYKALERLRLSTDTESCVGVKSENKCKNRDDNIIPRDSDRPALVTFIEGSTDYINAVYIDGYRRRRAFIVTQMPLPETVCDIWRMIYDHKSHTLVVLSAPKPTDKMSMSLLSCINSRLSIEADRGYYRTVRKMAGLSMKTMPIFWPTLPGSSLVFEPLKIECLRGEEYVSDHIIAREFRVTNTEMGNKDAVQVMLFCYAAWCDDTSVPSCSESILRLLNVVKCWQEESEPGPVTVVCSDGAGRCGLFVAASVMMEKLAADQEAHSAHVVKLVRRTRPHIIHNQEQYRFLYQLLLDSLIQSVDNPVYNID